MALVTVYITNYNYAKFVQQAIESVLHQTYQQLELIIIDDGSTDNSKEIIESYADQPKIKVIFQQNKGLNFSNNIALRVAQGRYIMRLDADDYLDSNALLVMVNMLERDEDLGLVFPDYYLVDQENNILSVEKRHAFKKDVTLLDMPAHGACTMIRKKFLQFLGGYDSQFTCQDGYELWVKFTAQFKVDNVATPLFYYRQHGSNLTTNEERILDTRAEIKEKFVEKNLETSFGIAIIPVRNSKYTANNLALTPLNGKFVLDWKIEAALNAKRIKLVVVSSPDQDIESHIHEKYDKTPRLIFHKRDERLARFNVGLVETVENIITTTSEINDINPEFLVMLAVEYPFIKAKTIDDAIHTMQIFNTNSVISVRPDTDMFFQHHGEGMKAILNQEKFSKLERDALFKYQGGILTVRVDDFKKNRKFVTGKVGHIVIDQKSAQIIKSKLDMKIAEFLAKDIS